MNNTFLITQLRVDLLLKMCKLKNTAHFDNDNAIYHEPHKLVSSWKQERSKNTAAEN